jgi:hypothetical protein
MHKTHIDKIYHWGPKVEDQRWDPSGQGLFLNERQPESTGGIETQADN